MRPGHGSHAHALRMGGSPAEGGEGAACSWCMSCFGGGGAELRPVQGASNALCPMHAEVDAYRSRPSLTQQQGETEGAPHVRRTCGMHAAACRHTRGCVQAHMRMHACMFTARTFARVGNLSGAAPQAAARRCVR